MKIGFRCEYKSLYDSPEGMSAPVRRSPVKARSRIPFDSGNRVQKKTFPESNTAFQERSYEKFYEGIYRIWNTMVIYNKLIKKNAYDFLIKVVYL